MTTAAVLIGISIGFLLLATCRCTAKGDTFDAFDARCARSLRSWLSGDKPSRRPR